MTINSKLYRIRFLAALEDPHPVTWPLMHPYWVVGETDKHSIIVAYADHEEYILAHWPEAIIEHVEETFSYSFSERFPCPDWFKSRAEELLAESRRTTPSLDFLFKR